jgi:hypothetical protein
VNWRIVFSIIVGFVVLFALGHFLGQPAHCADGWASPSIGHRGACSHHHGVAGPSIVDLLRLALAIAAGCVAYRYVWGALTAVWARRAAKTPPLAGDRGKSFEKPLTWMPEKIENIRGMTPTRTVDIGSVIAKATLVVVAIVIALAASAAVHEAMVFTNTDISTATVAEPAAIESPAVDHFRALEEAGAAAERANNTEAQ